MHTDKLILMEIVNINECDHHEFGRNLPEVSYTEVEGVIHQHCFHWHCSVTHQTLHQVQSRQHNVLTKFLK